MLYTGFSKCVKKVLHLVALTHFETPPFLQQVGTTLNPKLTLEDGMHHKYSRSRRSRPFSC